MTPSQLLAAQTYLLAVLLGQTDPATLANDARCFSCLTVAQLQAIKTYLLCQFTNVIVDDTLTPQSGDWSVVTSATVPEGVDFTRISAFPTGYSWLAVRYRVTGSGSDFTVDGSIYDAASWSISMPLGSTSYDFQVAWAVNPTTLSNWSATKTATSQAA